MVNSVKKQETLQGNKINKGKGAANTCPQVRIFVKKELVKNMRSLKQQFLAGGVTLGLLAGLALSGGTAFADSVTGSAALTGDSLTETSSATPSISTTINGTDQAKTYTVPITAADETGSGSGWNMTITSTTFTTGGGSAHTLSDTASTITGITSTCAAGTTCTDPSNSITYPMSLPAAASAPLATKLFNADLNTGMGQFTVTPTISVALPANVYAGSYSTTVTLAIVSGP